MPTDAWFRTPGLECLGASPDNKFELFDGEEEVCSMPLTELAVDEGPHNMDGMLLHARHGSENVGQLMRET